MSIDARHGIFRHGEKDNNRNARRGKRVNNRGRPADCHLTRQSPAPPGKCAQPTAERSNSVRTVRGAAYACSQTGTEGLVRKTFPSLVPPFVTLLVEHTQCARNLESTQVKRTAFLSSRGFFVQKEVKNQTKQQTGINVLQKTGRPRTEGREAGKPEVDTLQRRGPPRGQGRAPEGAGGPHAPRVRRPEPRHTRPAHLGEGWRCTPEQGEPRRL